MIIRYFWLPVDLLECFNEQHDREIYKINALTMFLERLVSNTDNWAVNLKCLIILNRAIQNFKVMQNIGPHFRKKRDLILAYTSKSEDEKTMTIRTISVKYANYLQFYLRLSEKIPMLAGTTMKNITSQMKSLSANQILSHSKYFQVVIEKIVAICDYASFCMKARLFANVIFVLLKDLFRIYKIFRMHMQEVLERFLTITDLAKLKQVF